MSKAAVLDLTGKFTKDMLARLARAEHQRDEALAALQALYDASPTGFGNDQALNSALIQAEQVLGIKP